ncbi:MAG: hypothetical protein KUG73_15195 [Pseudomonadales bacterium]|nr:hypothetical protein [Pseudomonadales bacterium]
MHLLIKPSIGIGIRSLPYCAKANDPKKSLQLPTALYVWIWVLLSDCETGLSPAGVSLVTDVKEQESPI